VIREGSQLHNVRRQRELMALAARRHGVVTVEDLAAAGVGPRGIARRVADGRLRRLHRGVFLVGPLIGPLTYEMAAAIACGPGAALSHRSAAALWRIRPAWHGPIEITVAGSQPRSRRGITVHRSRSLEATRRQGVPVTTPARTLLDIAALISERDLARAVEEAQVLRLVTPRALMGQVGRGRPGAASLRAAVHAQFEPSLTRSEAEALLLELVRGAGLPAPETNARLLGHEVDFLWRGAKLVVEVDGFAYHSTREAFERDRRRDARLQAAGYRVVRFTYRQIVSEPGAVIKCLDRYITHR
jgi:very-short-patch-repair endonuclease/predicted transcriptional regulator of viral defense system